MEVNEIMANRPPKAEPKPLLIGDKVTKRFGGLTALSEVDFEVREGEVMGLIGPNGSGKSTLLNVISGFFMPDKGVITFNGVKITGKKPSPIAKLGIGRTFQFVRPCESISAIDNVALGVLYGANEGSLTRARQKALEILDFVGLADKANAIASDLMAAERKRLEIARALSVKPKLILLDEVFAGLNQVELKEGISLIFRILNELGITIFMIEHVMSVIMKTCTRIMVLDYGHKIAEGTAEEVTKNPRVIEAYLGASICLG